MKVHGALISPNVRKVLVALDVKGLKYEQIMVLPGTRTPEHLKISPLGLMPAFEDGDFHISDSTVIAEYIEEQYPDKPIMPSKPAERARSRWLTEYGGSAVIPCCATIFVQRFANPYYAKKPTDESVVEHAVTTMFPPVLDYLESQVPSEGFLFGEFGLADISIVSPMINAQYGNYNVDKTRWPKLAAFVDRAKSQPAFARRLEAEASMIAAIKRGDFS